MKWIQYNIIGKLTFAEYLESHQFNARKRRFWVRVISALVGFLLIACGLFFAPQAHRLWFVTVGVFYLLYSLLLSPLIFRYLVRRRWKQNPRLHKPFAITILPDGVQIPDDKGNPSHSDWSSFIRFAESDNLFLLYLSPTLSIPLPKRLITDEDKDALREWFSTSITVKNNK